MLLQQLFTMEKYQNCNCIERLEKIGSRMHSLRPRVQQCDFWIQEMERRFSYLPGAGNVDNPPTYVMCRELSDYLSNALDDVLRDIKFLLQKQRRNGHTAPATRRQSRRLLKKHHDAVANMRARCIPLYTKISHNHYGLSMIVNDPPNLASWIIPRVSVSNAQVDDGDQCAVCLETFAIDETVSQLGCSHCFHINCLDPLITTNWQSDNFRCPLCRRPFLKRP